MTDAGPHCRVKGALPGRPGDSTLQVCTLMLGASSQSAGHAWQGMLTAMACSMRGCSVCSLRLQGRQVLQIAETECLLDIHPEEGGLV